MFVMTTGKSRQNRYKQTSATATYFKRDWLEGQIITFFTKLTRLILKRLSRQSWSLHKSEACLFERRLRDSFTQHIYKLISNFLHLINLSQYVLSLEHHQSDVHN